MSAGEVSATYGGRRKRHPDLTITCVVGKKKKVCAIAPLVYKYRNERLYSYTNNVFSMLTVEEVSRRLEDRTLTKVAKATGLSYPTILKVASGDTGIAYETVRILSDYLEASA